MDELVETVICEYEESKKNSSCEMDVETLTF